MKIIPLSEGSFTIDQTKEFIPFDTNTDDLQLRSRGSLLVEIQPLLVITRHDIILLDTGLGYCNSEEVLQIHQNLMNHHINPMQVTKVLMSHLHKDHAGGMVKYDQQLRKYFLGFPQATYYINRQEMHFALQGKNPSYKPERMEALYHSENVQLLDDRGTIDQYISFEMTGAHSPFHQVFTIREDGQTIFFGADDAPQLRQMKNKVMAKYDFDGKKSMELRQGWWRQGNAEGWTFLFYHDIATPVFQAAQ